MIIFNLEYVINKLKELSENKGDKFNIEVEINGRLTRTLGRVVSHRINGYVKPVKLEISKRALIICSKRELDSIIGHEWCHYYISKTTGKAHGHDKMFKMLCHEIGIHGGSEIFVDRLSEVNERKIKYETKCTHCGGTTGRYCVRAGVVKNPELYSSGCCGANIVVKEI